MKKILLSLAALLIIKSSLHAQNTFQRSVYSNNLIISPDLTNANNGGYMVTGILNPNQDYLSAALLDGNGNTKWNRYFSDGTNEFYNVKVCQTNDSGFIIASSGLSSSLTFILKTDKSGNLLWSENISGNSIFFYSYRIVASDDGGALISGRAADSTGERVYILKLNGKNGHVLWAKTFQGSTKKNTFNSGNILDITSSVAGGYIACGYWEYFDSGNISKTAAFIAKFSNDGNYGGSKFYNNSNVNALTKANANNYIITGNNSGKAFYAKVNDRGNAIWAKQLMSTDNIGANAIAANANGTYTFVGENYFGNINNDGSLNWYKIPKHYTKLNFSGLAKAADGGYASISKKFLSRTDSAFIIKIDANGNTCHGSVTQNFEIKNVQLQVSAITGVATDVTNRIVVSPDNFKAFNKPFFNTIFCTDQLNANQQNNQLFSDDKNNLQLSILSNPVNNLLNYQIKNTESSSVNISISNMQGNIFYTKKLTVTNVVQHSTIDVAALTPGIYILKVSDGKQQQFIKFVKQ